ncbi:hypothetical protein MMPV_004831 [Pyropia vietnamensis]
MAIGWWRGGFSWRRSPTFLRTVRRARRWTAWALGAGIAAAAVVAVKGRRGEGGGGGSGVNGGGDGCGGGVGGGLGVGGGWLFSGGFGVKRPRTMGGWGGRRVLARRIVSRIGLMAIGMGILGGVALLASAPGGFRRWGPPALASGPSARATTSAVVAAGRSAAVWGIMPRRDAAAPATARGSRPGALAAANVGVKPTVSGPVVDRLATATADGGWDAHEDVLGGRMGAAATAAPPVTDERVVNFTSAGASDTRGTPPGAPLTAGAGGSASISWPTARRPADAAPAAPAAASVSRGSLLPGGATTNTAAAAAALAAAAADADAPPKAVAAALIAAAADADASAPVSIESGGAAVAAAAAADAPHLVPAGATVHCYDRADVATMTEALCVYAPFSAAMVAAVVRSHSGGGSGGGSGGASAPFVGCSAWDGTALPEDKANCSRVVAAAAASTWWTATAAKPGGDSLGGSIGGGTGPPSVLLRLAARDVNIAHAGMKLLALHHVLRHPARYGLPPNPAVVIHLADTYIAPVVHNATSWQAGLLAAVLAASPVGRVTVTESLAATPAAYAVAAVVGGWSNRFSVGDSHAPLDAPVNIMAREDHAALRTALPLPSRPLRRVRSGSDRSSDVPPPLRVVYLSRRHNHRRRFDPASETRFVRTLQSVALAAGDAVVEVVATGTSTPFADQIAAVADADVVIGLHGASLTTVLVGAWSGAPGELGGTLIEVRPYGFRLRLFDGVSMVGAAYVAQELMGHGPEYGGRRRRPSADGAGWRESALACSWRDFRCFEYYRDATQDDVTTVRALVEAALNRARNDP